nr:MAG TPA: hypothetical protein [Caudoviricetes sp.]
MQTIEAQFMLIWWKRDTPEMVGIPKGTRGRL